MKEKLFVFYHPFCKPVVNMLDAIPIQSHALACSIEIHDVSYAYVNNNEIDI